MQQIITRSATAAIMSLALAIPFAEATSQAGRMRPPSDTARVTALNLTVISRASWFEQASLGGTPGTLATDVIATPSMRFVGGRIGVWATSAYTPLRMNESEPAWTNAIGLDMRRGSMSMSLSVGQDVGYRTHRTIVVGPAPVPDTLNFFQRDSLAKGTLPPRKPIAGDTSIQTTSRPVLVGASTAALQWTGSWMSARAYYGLVIGNTGSRRPLGGADVNVALGVTSLMLALEQRIAPADRNARGGGLVAHVGFRFDAVPWSRRARTTSAEPTARLSPDSVTSIRFIAEHTDRGIRLRLHAPGARQVELSGSLTSWESLAMKPEAGGWWEVVLQGDKGLHRLRVRVDGGAWTAPPNVAANRDEFGEPVGIVVVQ